ncbi:MAG: pyridoxal-phosphate dependent enzyme [Microbacteriaceae bacterium]|nr:pyridoxal-phosphate dependent enzyme [Microbacteriaceae bacterium]
MISIQDIRDAAGLIGPYIVRTPLVRAEALEAALGSRCRIFLKCEHEQVTRSFKPRGAFHALLRLSPEEKVRGVVSRSSGNFAQGLAYAGKQLGIPVGRKIENGLHLGRPLVRKLIHTYHSRHLLEWFFNIAEME